MPSLFSESPGPDVEVTPRHPANEAPMAEHTPAISSSAWKTTAPRLFHLGKFLQNFRCRGNGVGAQEEFPAGFFSCSKQVPMQWQYCR